MRFPARTAVAVRDGPGSPARRMCHKSASCIRGTSPSAPGPTGVEQRQQKMIMQCCIYVYTNNSYTDLFNFSPTCIVSTLKGTPNPYFLFTYCTC